MDLSWRAYDEMVADPMSLVSTMIRQHDAAAEMLNRLHLHVIALAARDLPGFVIGDTPVVHAMLDDGRYGFRDHLALGDANFIMGPLTRTTAACFTVRPLSPVLVGTRKKLDAINAIFSAPRWKRSPATRTTPKRYDRRTHASTGCRRPSSQAADRRLQVTHQREGRPMSPHGWAA